MHCNKRDVAVLPSGNASQLFSKEGRYPMSVHFRRSARLAAAVSSVLSAPVLFGGALALGLLPGVAQAQETTAQIVGTITGANGEAVAGATVTILHVPSGTTVTTRTNDSGRFGANGVRLGGPFKIDVAGDGFEPRSIDNVYTTLGRPFALNVALKSLETIAEVEVTGTRENSQQMGVTAQFNANDIANSPSINRDLKDIVRNDPAIYIDPQNSNAISIAGQNSRFNSITVDGVKQNDDFGLNNNGYATNRSPVSLDAIQSLSVATSPFDPQYSGFQGGSINVVTKSGTNDFSGSVYYYYNDDSFAGDKTKDRVINLTFEEKSYGATLGGPILQDKLFFFVNYEKFERVSPISVGPRGSGFAAEQTRPTLAELEAVVAAARSTYNFDALDLVSSVPEESEKILVNLDWNINDNHRARYSYQRTEDFDISGTPTNSTFSSYSSPSQWYERGYKLDQNVLQVFSNWTDAFSTELKVARKKVGNRQEPLGGNTFAQMTINLPTTVQYTPGTFGSGGSIIIGPDISRHANSLANETQQFKFRANYLLDRHTLSAGLEREKLDVFNLFVQNAQGVYTFANLADFVARRAATFFYTNSVLSNPNDVNDGAASFSYTNTAAYLQDRWQVTDNFLLSYGVRVERFSGSDRPRANNAFATRYGFSNNESLDGRKLVSPRIGFEWNVTEKTTVSGGFGLFGGGTPNVWISNSFSNDGVVLGSLQVNRPTTGTLTALQDAALNNFNGFDIPALVQSQIVTNGAGAATVNAIDPDFNIPSSWRYTLGVDHEADLWFLGDAWRLSAEGQYTEVKDAVLWRDLRLVQIGTLQDGRPRYGYRTTDPAAGTRGTGINDMLLTNTNGGRTQQLTLQAEKAWDTRFGLFDLSLGYAFTNAEEVSPATSSVALSNWDNMATSDINNPGVTTSAYEVRHRFPIRLSWRKNLFGDNESAVNLFVERRAGLPYSFTFAGTASGLTGNAADLAAVGVFGDPRHDNRSRQLFYVPNGPTDVLFSTNGASNLNWATLDAFITANGLDKYRGQIAPRNGFRSPWVTTADLQFRQELPGFGEGHKGVLTVDILNVANLINKKWGSFGQVGFPYVVPVVAVEGLDPATGKYIYRGLSGVGSKVLNTNPPQQSLWRIQVGLRYEF
jgi:outer membrane receptor for ferrienterochelin and colicin